MCDGQTWNNPAAHLANGSLTWITIDKTDAPGWMDRQMHTAHGHTDLQVGHGVRLTCVPDGWMERQTDRHTHNRETYRHLGWMVTRTHTHTHTEWTDTDLQDWWTDWCTKWTDWCSKWTDTWDTGTLTHRMDTPMDGWTDCGQKWTDIWARQADRHTERTFGGWLDKLMHYMEREQEGDRFKRTDTQTYWCTDRQTGAQDERTGKQADIYQITNRPAVPGVTLDLTQLDKDWQGLMEVIRVQRQSTNLTMQAV